jgi:gluconolactonase
MRPILLSLLLAVSAFAADPEPGPDSKVQPGVPKGEVLKLSFDRSRIFPGTYRDYWVYVPAQYTPDKPACLYVNQDGIQWQAPTVFDNLIHKGEMPLTIGVFVVHGRVRARDGNAALDRFNRSFEYDGLGDRYARFLAEELLPEVETKKTSDGRPIRISHDPKDRAIGGSSSGAVCAFTAAWERPDQFSRVFSAIGTYVGLRGADRYPTLIRKYEPKPIRVYLQDGSADLNIYAGDWWMANQMMERALTFAGYEVRHAWGEGGHSGQHGTAVFPDAMRWLWKDWPQPVKTRKSKNGMLNEILAADQGWQPAGEGHGSDGSLTANARGEVFFSNGQGGKTYRLGPDGTAAVFLNGPKKGGGGAFGPDGRLYLISGDGKIVAHDSTGKASSVTRGVRGNDLVIAANGNIYVTEPGPGGTASSKVWLVKADGRKRVVDTGLRSATGITLSPDQSLLYVADGDTHWIYSYQIQPDGSLDHKQPYYWLHVPDDSDQSSAGGMAVDRDGRLYVATNLGVQVCDQAGRVNCILPVPGGPVSSLCFGGENSGTLFAAAGGKIYRRQLAVKGAHAWDVPNKPPAPRL